MPEEHLKKSGARIRWNDIGQEPFRVFFPAATAAGVAGAALWPLHITHVMDFYPGVMHARMMANGFFGGFITGFLGTALPRMLSAPRLTLAEALGLLTLYLAMCAQYLRTKIVSGDWLFLGLLAAFAVCGAVRFFKRKDNPPPAFILVLTGLLCAAAGAALAIAEADSDEPQWAALQHLLSYQGFVLFPIIGVGPFLLPRFFGLPSGADVPESRRFNAQWLKQAGIAAATAAIILFSFYLEFAGWHRTGPAVRLVAAAAFIVTHIPVFAKAKTTNAFAVTLKVAFAMLLGGFAAVVAQPSQRVALLHLTLIGGFAAITFSVATRVIFGHSGKLDQMSKPNWWFFWIMCAMWFAMLTRISGDYAPQIRFSHYAYGATLWILAVAFWACKVLGKVLEREEE